jgi:nucleotide-binding universal stress UspA family protein
MMAKALLEGVMFERLLVPLDGSDIAEMVLPYVITITGTFSREVILVTAAEADSLGKSHFFASYLETTAASLRKSMHKPGIAISAKVLKGKPAEEILRYAKEMKSDLIIVAGHGGSSGSPLQLGSVATRILAASPKPVLLVKRKVDAVSKEGSITRIMVPLDGSKMSADALMIAESMAAGLKAELVLFQAVEPVRYVPGFETMAPNIVLPSDDEIKRSAAKYLDEIAAPLKQKGSKVSSVVISDAPAEAILDYADSGNIDIIAMTTHGFSGIKRWVFGSTTEKVLQASEKPVLVIPSSKS